MLCVCMYVCFILVMSHIKGRGGHKEKEKEIGKTENKEIRPELLSVLVFITDGQDKTQRTNANNTALHQIEKPNVAKMK